MRKTWLVLAVLLAGNIAVCRAEDKKDDDKPATAEKKADAKDMKKDDGKDYVEAVDAKDMAPAPACAPKSGIVCAAPAKCRCGRGADCCQRVWAWLTYRPLKKPCLWNCCHKCGDCHVPPLYLYFLDPYHACASGNGCATCAAAGCAGCAQP